MVLGYLVLGRKDLSGKATAISGAGLFSAGKGRTSLGKAQLSVVLGYLVLGRKDLSGKATAVSGAGLFSPGKEGPLWERHCCQWCWVI